MSKYSEVVERAYQNNELVKLLSGDKSYIVDEKGNYYLAENLRSSYASSIDESDPMDLEAILSAIESMYCSINRIAGLSINEKKERKTKIKNALQEFIFEMMNSADVTHVYFAARVYFILCYREQNILYYPLHIINDSVKNAVNAGLERNKDALKETKIYIGKNNSQGLWGVLIKWNDCVSDTFKLESILC